jgi:hypothetical protein
MFVHSKFQFSGFTYLFVWGKAPKRTFIMPCHPLVFKAPHPFTSVAQHVLCDVYYSLLGNVCLSFVSGKSVWEGNTCLTCTAFNCSIGCGSFSPPDVKSSLSP